MLNGRAVPLQVDQRFAVVVGFGLNKQVMEGEPFPGDLDDPAGEPGVIEEDDTEWPVLGVGGSG